MAKVTQIFVYTAKDPEVCEAARERLLSVWAEVPGFISWKQLRRPEHKEGIEANVFADYMEWDSPEACERGNEVFRNDDRVASFRDQIAELVTGNEYVEA